jgi:hypothetical protein
MRRLLSSSALFALVAFLGAVLLPASAVAGTPVSLGTRLTGAAINSIEPEGHAYYHLGKNGNSQFDIEVENVDLPDGTTLNVNHNGTEFTTVVLLHGESLWRLQSKLGDTIPAMAAGDTISVTDANGNLIDGGTLHAPEPVVQLASSLVGPAINKKATTGTANYASHGTRQTFKLKVAVNLIDGTVLTANDNGVALGTLTLAAGKATLSLDTNNGDTVPTMTAGDVITVTLANGDVVLYGILEDSSPTVIKAHTQLSGAAIDHVTPFGNALYRATAKNSSFTAGALNVNMADGTVVSFNVNGVSVGAGILRDGRVFLRLDSEDGDTVPTVHVGDIITITDAAATILLHGKAKP